MLKVDLIGYLGTDAELKEIDGGKFVTCRVAHTDTWTGKDGVKHEQTQWVDVIVQYQSRVIPYLKRGTMVYVRGNMRTRVYSSQKDRCMKAGITINVSEIQLLSAKKEEEENVQSDAPFIG